jgi:hypothetical protein
MTLLVTIKKTNTNLMKDRMLSLSWWIWFAMVIAMFGILYCWSSRRFLSRVEPTEWFILCLHLSFRYLNWSIFLRPLEVCRSLHKKMMPCFPSVTKENYSNWSMNWLNLSNLTNPSLPWNYAYKLLRLSIGPKIMHNSRRWLMNSALKLYWYSKMILEMLSKRHLLSILFARQFSAWLASLKKILTLCWPTACPVVHSYSRNQPNAPP